LKNDTDFKITKKKTESPQIGLVSYYPYCDRDTAYFLLMRSGLIESLVTAYT